MGGTRHPLASKTTPMVFSRCFPVKNNALDLMVQVFTSHPKQNAPRQFTPPRYIRTGPLASPHHS